MPLGHQTDLAPALYPQNKRIKMQADRSDRSWISSQLRTPGHHSLCVAIIEQAVTDYFSLVRAKAVKAGRLTEQWEAHVSEKSKRVGHRWISGMTQMDAETCVSLLRDISAFADAIELRRDWADFWDQILRLERSGNYSGAIERIKGGVDERTVDGDCTDKGDRWEGVVLFSFSDDQLGGYLDHTEINI